MLLACCSCGSKTEQTKETTSSTIPEKDILSIPQLHDRLTDDSIALQELQDGFPNRLRTDFRWCDSMLAYIPEGRIEDFFNTLNLTQAYLSQFDEMLPIMNHDLGYLRQQLTNLQHDIDTHYLSDSLANAYLLDENAAADTLHYRILYFKDRLSQQDKELQSLKDNIRKARKK